MPGYSWPAIRLRLKRALKHLWNMIAHLVRVKEWTLEGRLGSDVLGLGSVSVSITFG
jgi:hypothetical protein